MRLIHTKTLQIEEFTGRKVPRYAILSHTWGDDELTFQDWLYVQNQSPPRWGWTQLPDEIQRIKSKEGYVKVSKACEHAQKHKPVCQWLWADTVCIDKTSSAELSEAINSMFEWYRRSEICYAFLVDVSPMTDEELIKCSQRTSPFRQSRWFRRGWTLQELIAPWSMVFLSNNWTILGTKSTLSRHIATITSIPETYLSGNWSRIRDQASIAQKMSWAARRQTTRVEDQAYCLMGLFEINMPLLYGEGGKAFMRLQEEIIKHAEDLSFLAWKSDRSQTFALDHFIHWKLPPLADSPSQFLSARNVIATGRDDSIASKRIFTANTGIFIHRALLGTLSPRFVFAPLNCAAFNLSRRSSESIWIPLVMDPLLQEFSRSSFPTSTVVTALGHGRCRMSTAYLAEVPLRQIYEPSPERFYLRKTQRISDVANPHRQVGILPVFSTRDPWIEDKVLSYPLMNQANPLIFNLAEVNENLYHGTLLVRVPLDICHPRGRGRGSTEPRQAFGVHFLVSFENNRPLFWSATPVYEPYASDLEDPPSAHLPAVTMSMTESILATTRSGSDAVRLVPKRDPGLPVSIAGHRDSHAFVQMDNRWHKFKSAGLETSFDTHINLVMFGTDSHSLPFQFTYEGPVRSAPNPISLRDYVASAGPDSLP